MQIDGSAREVPVEKISRVSIFDNGSFHCLN